MSLVLSLNTESQLSPVFDLYNFKIQIQSIKEQLITVQNELQQNQSSEQQFQDKLAQQDFEIQSQNEQISQLKNQIVDQRQYLNNLKSRVKQYLSVLDKTREKVSHLDQNKIELTQQLIKLNVMEIQLEKVNTISELRARNQQDMVQIQNNIQGLICIINKKQ